MAKCKVCSWFIFVPALLLTGLGVIQSSAAFANSELIDSLIHKVSELKSHNVDSAYSLATTAYELSVQSNYFPGQVEALNRLGMIERNNGRYIESIKKHYKAYNVARNLKDFRLQSKSQIYLGISTYRAGNWEASRRHLNHSLRLSSQINDSALLTTAYLNLRNTYVMLGHVDSASYCLQKAIQLEDDSEPNKRVFATKFTLASLLAQGGKYDEALETFQECEDGFRILGDSLMLSRTYQSYALIFSEQSKHESALQNMRKALILADVMGNQHEVSRIEHNFGITLLDLSRYKEGFERLEEAIRLRRALGLRYELASSLNTHAQYNLDLRNFEVAHESLMEAMAIAMFDDFSDLLVDALELQIRLNLEWEANPLRMEEIETYINLRDSLEEIAIEKERASGEMRLAVEALQWDLLRANQANQTLKLENEAARWRLFLAITLGVAGVLVAVLIGIFRIRASRMKLQAEQEKSKLKLEAEQERSRLELRAEQEKSEMLQKERNRVRRDMHDRFGTSFFSIRALLDSVQNSYTSGKAPTALERVVKLIERLEREWRAIAKNLQNGGVYEKGLFASLQLLAEESNATPGSIEMEVNGLEIRFEELFEYYLYYLVQELILNAQKHSKANLIRVSFEFMENEDLVIVVEDDGIGIADLAEARTNSLGFESVEARLAHVEGQIKILSNPGKGTKIELTIPATNVKHRNR